jgi:hypothetical protein
MISGARRTVAACALLLFQDFSFLFRQAARSLCRNFVEDTVNLLLPLLPPQVVRYLKIIRRSAGLRTGLPAKNIP